MANALTENACSAIKCVGSALATVAMMAICGCQSGLYKVSTSEDDAKIDESVRYYTVEHQGFMKHGGSSPEGILYDEEQIPVEIVAGNSEKHPDKPGLSGVLWMFTLGIWPMCHSEYMTQSVTVKSPIGEKTGTYRVDAKWWAGWFPIFIGYPGLSDEREANAQLPNSRLEKIGKDRLVKNLVGQISQTDYVAFAKRENAARKTELDRIAASQKKIASLLSQHKYSEASSMLESEAKKRAGSLDKDQEMWNELQQGIRRNEIEHLLSEKKYVLSFKLLNDEPRVGFEASQTYQKLWPMAKEMVLKDIPTMKDVDALVSLYSETDHSIKEAILLRLAELKAISKIGSEMLFHMIQQTKSSDVQCAAIEGITDVVELKKIAFSGLGDRVSNIALKKLNFTPFGAYSKAAIAECRQKANQGDPEAQYLYALAMRDEMVRCNRDAYQYYKELILKYATKAARKEYGPAYYLAGCMFKDAPNADEWKAKAVTWATKNAERGDPVAMMQLYWMYNSGNGVSKDKAKGEVFLKNAADAGLPAAQISVALGLANQSYAKIGSCIGKESKELAQLAADAMRIPAEKGNPIAQYKLAEWLKDGMEAYNKSPDYSNMHKEKRIEANTQEYCSLLQKSAEQGYPPACHELAIAYEQGIGCAKDIAAYVKWMKIAADNGDPDAMYTLGVWLEEGTYVSINMDESVRFIKLAAESRQGGYGSDKAKAQAAEKLSKWYEVGYGVLKKDLNESAKWLEKAASLDGKYDKELEAKYPISAMKIYGERMKMLSARKETARDPSWVEKRIAEYREKQNKLSAAVANAMDVISVAKVEELKRNSIRYKDNTFVFKGLYLGMDAQSARQLLRYYIGNVSNEVSEVDGRAFSFLLSRTQVDKMFKTKGVSAEAFCKSVLSAYPVVGGFDSRVEEIADMAARKKFMAEAEADAIANMNASSPFGAYAQGVAAGREARRRADKIMKYVKCFYCESPKGFLLEIRPEQPDRFFTLKQISSLKKGNFD